MFFPLGTSLLLILWSVQKNSTLFLTVAGKAMTLSNKSSESYWIHTSHTFVIISTALACENLTV